MCLKTDMEKSSVMLSNIMEKLLMISPDHSRIHNLTYLTTVQMCRRSY